MHVIENGINLETFKKATSNMVKANDVLGGWGVNESTANQEYTIEEIERIINEGSTEEQQILSRYFFYRNGFYSRILIHYATLLKYIGILIPKLSYNQSINTKANSKKYYSASKLCDQSNFATIFTNCSLKVLIDGRYYGFITTTKDKMYLIDLPYKYCRVQYTNLDGEDLVEFNLSYFDSIIDETDRKNALSFYPKEIRKEYYKFKKNKRQNSWMILNPETTVTFAFPESSRPMLLNIIPASLQYDDAVDTERERDKEEIKKIIVQKIPHNNQNEFLLEPPEVEELHSGAVGMLKDNDNLRVLTTYADVDAIISKTANDSASTALQQMLRNVYAKAGVSGQLFASDSNLAIEISLENDTAFMMLLAYQYSTVITKILNKLYGNNNIGFKYQFLPITYHNDDKYLETALKLGNNGYSFILPALSMGLTQGDLTDIKELENTLLELHNKLIPLATSYTQSNTEGKTGAPALEPTEKSDKTIRNEASAAKE